MPRINLSSHYIKHHLGVRESVQNKINEIPSSPLKEITSELLDRIIREDTKHEVTLLPLLIADVFKVRLPAISSQQLSALSLWGWMAYTAYDDLLDQEHAKQLLPTANYCLRNALDTLTQTLPDIRDFHKLARNILDKQDAANSWELANCRGLIVGNNLKLQNLPNFGDYWQLAHRSLGHTISALGVLYYANIEQSQLQATQDFFHYYLISRQLNDDAHDWEEDLKSGHVNSVADILLRQHLANHIQMKQSELIINLSEDIEILREIMWIDAVDDINMHITDNLARAESALSKLKNTLDIRPFQLMLKPLQTAVSHATDTRKELLNFMNASQL